MSTKKPLSQTALSSPDVSSLAGSVAGSEDRLDSDLEADLQQVVGLLENVHTIDNEHFSVTSSDVLSGPSGSSDCRACLPSSTATGEASTKPSAFFRKAVLSGVSSQLKNASSKVDVGKPSCLSFRKYLVIGTTKGVIFGFNLQQVLRFCLGSIDSAHGVAENLAGHGQDPVSVLSQTIDGTRLLSGYQSGLLAVWRLSPPATVKSSSQPESHMVRGKLSVTDENADALVESVVTERVPRAVHDVTHPVDLSSSPTGHKSTASRTLQQTLSGAKSRLASRSSSDTAIGQLLYVIDDAHGVGQAIAFASFTTLPSVAVSVDTGGSVFALNFKRGLTGSRKDSICFFSGSRGEICALDTLGSTALLSDTSGGQSASVNLDPDQEGVQRSDKSLGSYALVAMASFTKLIVAQLRPRVQIAYWQPLTGPVACLPLVTWQWDYRAPSRSSTGSSERALLAFGRGSTFRLLQVTRANAGSAFDVTKTEETKTLLHFSVLHTFNLGYELMCLNWLSSSQVAALDVTETLHLLDSTTGEDAETIDLFSVQLCYNSYLFQSSADGGSVSEALAYAGQRACSQSVATHGSQLLVLGQTGVHLVTLRKWTDIVRSLLSHGMLDSALIYCQRALESAQMMHASSAVSRFRFDLSGKQIPAIPNPNLPEAQLRSVISEMLREQLAPMLASDIPNDHHRNGTGSDSGNNNFMNFSEARPRLSPLIVALAVRVACLLDNCDIFVSDLYENLRRDPQTRSWLFISMYEIMFRQMPRFGQWCCEKRMGTRNVADPDCLPLSQSLPPNLVMDWIGWCLIPEYDVDRANWPVSVIDSTMGTRAESGNGRVWAEQALLCLPPNCLDLNEAVRLCWRHHMFKAYLHLYLDVLLDFETPFRELIDKLDQDSRLQRSSLTNVDDVSRGNMDDMVVPYTQTLLLLLRNALAGESYSQQPLPSPMDVDVPTHIFNLLLNEALPVKATGGRDHGPQFQPKYPRLWLLLSHNAADFLNLLTLSIGSDRFFSSEGGELSLSHRSHLYHKLIACALEEELCPEAIGDNPFTTGSSSEFPPVARIAIPVFGFLAHQFTSTTGVPVQFNFPKMFQLFEHICLQLEKSTSFAPVAFETCVIELLETERFTKLDACLKLAERAKLFHLSEHIYRKLGHRVKAFEAQLNRLNHLTKLSGHRLRVELVDENRTMDSELEQLTATVYAFLDHVFSYNCVPSVHVCGFSPAEIEQTQSLVLSNIELLAMWDAERILRLLYNMFRLPLPELLTKISPDFVQYNNEPDAEFRVRSITCALILHAYYRSRQLQLDLHSAHAEFTGTWSTQRHKTNSSEIPRSLTDWGQFLTRSHPEVADFFVCVLAGDPRGSVDSAQLLRFLKTNSDYRVDRALNVLSPTDHPRECAYLYEKRGQFEEASSIYEQMFVTRWHTLVQLVSNESDPAAMYTDKHTELSRTEARTAADLWFAFAQRRSAVLSDGDTNVDVEKIWFHVIDVLLREEQVAKSQALESVLTDINDLFHSLLSYLPRSISLTTIVSYILQSATSQTTSRFNPKTSNLLTRLVATCHVEVDQMTLNCELAKRELTEKQSTLLARLRQGFSVASGGLSCDLCQASLRSSSRMIDYKRLRDPTISAKPKPAIVIFRCQHIFHTYCLLSVGAGETDIETAATHVGFRPQWTCPVCNPCPIRGGLTSTVTKPASPGAIRAQLRPRETKDENDKVKTTEAYLSWYDPIKLDLRQHSNNPFD